MDLQLAEDVTASSKFSGTVVAMSDPHPVADKYDEERHPLADLIGLADDSAGSQEPISCCNDNSPQTISN